jgi:hypothetical protein
MRVTEQLLRLARDGARNLDARLVVLVIPERSQVMRAEGSPPTGLDDIEQHFIAWFAREGILHVEALASLRGALRRGEDVFFQRDGHLNAAGHRVVGELLARQLAPLLGRESSGYSGACTGELSVREAPTR